MINNHQHKAGSSNAREMSVFSIETVRSLCVAMLSISVIAFISGCDRNIANTNDTALSESELTQNSHINAVNSTKSTRDSACHNDVIANAYAQQRSDVQVKGCGQVVAVLKDDNEGTRHQRFIVSLEGISPKHTILIAHNIDLAPRVNDLQKGDVVTFYGEYEFNPQGGVVHWTHHDPAARHQNGWIEKDNKRYE